MSELLRTRCVCGWETTGPEDDVVGATLDHGQRVHNMGGTREDVLERAERLAVVDVPDRRRFEARLGATLVGFTQYEVRDTSIDLLHTEIDPDFEGKGFGSKLAAGVLADAIGRGLPVTVRCPFISAYVRRHPGDYPTMDFKTNRIAVA
jgi:predicted GNAT family acetyltransferase